MTTDQPAPAAGAGPRLSADACVCEERAEKALLDAAEAYRLAHEAHEMGALARTLSQSLDAARAERDIAKRHLDLLALEASRRFNENANTIERLEQELATTRADLTAATSLADARALALAEMREALVEDGECVLCDGTPEKHEAGCLLAQPPDTRGAELLAAGDALADGVREWAGRSAHRLRDAADLAMLVDAWDCLRGATTAAGGEGWQ